MATKQPRRRRRGEVEEMPSGALRVRVHAGIDPVTKRRHRLEEIVPAGPRAAAQAEKVRTRLLAELDAGRQSRTSATVSQLMERYLEVVHVEPSTRQSYEGLVRKHIIPLLGEMQAGRIRGDVLDSFYAELRRCRAYCRRERGLVDHRTGVEHECDERCRPHQCRPLGEGTIRHAHNLLNGAFTPAVRWEWVGVNPEPPSPQTLALLRAYLVHTAAQAAELGLALPEDGFVFSPNPDGATWPKPGTATQRYSRMCARLGYSMHLHQLRHYSATELISGGVDVRTVAGRLGHGGGGATTLRVYSAWVAEADQRASSSLATRMPQLPEAAVPEQGRPAVALPARPAGEGEEPSDPYKKIAADFEAAIRCGALKPEDQLPPIKDIAARYGVASSTGHRALALLTERGKVVVSAGRRAKVVSEGDVRFRRPVDRVVLGPTVDLGAQRRREEPVVVAEGFQLRRR